MSEESSTEVADDINKGDLGDFKMDTVTSIPINALNEQQKSGGTLKVPSCYVSCISLIEIRDGSEEETFFFEDSITSRRSSMQKLQRHTTQVTESFLGSVSRYILHAPSC